MSVNMVDEATYKELKKRIKQLEEKDSTHRKCEQELIESRQIFSMSIDMICIADINSSTFLKVNPAFTEILGWSEKELLQKPFLEFVHPDDIESTQSVVEEKLRLGAQSINFENRYRCKDGSYRWLSWVSHPNPDQGKTYAIAHDITDQKQMVQKLSESEKKYKSLFRNAQVALFRTNLDGQLIETNKRYAEIAGYDNVDDCMAEYCPKNAWSRPEARNEFLEKIQKAESVSDYEAEIMRKDGSTAWILFSARVFPNEGYLEGSIVNITDRKKAESSLRESEARFRALHNASFGGITIHDKGTILECNQGLSEITGYSVDELIGMNGLRLIAEQSRPMVMDKILSGYEEPYEAIGLLKNGEEYPIRLEGRNIPYKGKSVRTVEFRDVTEQKKAEQDREKLQNQLTQAQKMESVGRLAAGMAHEINNPLAGVIQNINVLSNRLSRKDIPANLKAAEKVGTSMDTIVKFLEDRRVPQILKAIADSGLRMAAIVDNLLNFSRKSHSAFSTHNPVELVEKTLELASTDFDLKKHYDFKAISIEREYEDNLPVISCEGNSVQQVILNILNNGAYAMGGYQNSLISKFTIRIKNEIDNDMLRIEIEDNGPGMDKNTLKKVFEPFFTTKPVGIGTGLGLSVSYFIITETHKGTIGIESELEKGTKFIVRLPVERKKI
ncbi:MAG: PAS domain S-box protein [Desulfobacterium sp.]|nr:PAS domain S-box protein [Desulfobacterium sp.]